MDKNRMTTRPLIVVLLIAFALFGMIARPAQAVPHLEDTPIPTQMSDTTLAVTPSKTVINPGETFDLVISISTDAQTRGVQFSIKFDPNLIEMTDGYEEGTFYSDWASQEGAVSMVIPQPVIDNSAGEVKLMGIAILGAAEGTGGPSGKGVVLTLSGKAKEGANGVATFKLNEVIVADAGDVQGTTSPLGGVKVQDGMLNVGSGQALETPVAREATQAGAQVAATLTPEPTIAKRSSLTEGQAAVSGGNIPWEIILPVGSAIVIGLGAFIFLRKPKA
jgi:hypothetical protein